MLRTMKKDVGIPVDATLTQIEEHIKRLGEEAEMISRVLASRGTGSHSGGSETPATASSSARSSSTRDTLVDRNCSFVIKLLGDESVVEWGKDTSFQYINDDIQDLWDNFDWEDPVAPKSMADLWNERTDDWYYIVRSAKWKGQTALLLSDSLNRSAKFQLYIPPRKYRKYAFRPGDKIKPISAEDIIVQPSSPRRLEQQQRLTRGLSSFETAAAAPASGSTSTPTHQSQVKK